jgi:hypothetical protein
MADDADPPRKFFQLKPKEFEAVNAIPRPADPAAPTVDSKPAAAAPSGPIDVRELARIATKTQTLLKGNVAANRANEVHAMLKDNLDRANAAGLNDISVRPKRKSKRKRDYFLTLLGGNLLLAFALTIQPIFAVAGLILFNIGLTWIMWVVMDDY